MEMQFPVILDGATGTELQKRGFTGDMSAEQWVLEHPESILEIQRKYVASGSNVLYAPTFGGNRQKLEERGIFNRTEEMNKALAQLSKQAADGKAWVAGDIAPTGRFLAPLGDASFEELVDIYTEQAAGLEQADVDLYVIETMMTLTDARAAVLAIRSMSKKPILVSFTCDESGKILSGTDVVAALSVMEGMGVSAFGLNCSGPEQMLPQLQRLHKYARVPLIAKPNAGMPEIVNGEAVYNCPPEEFVALVPEMLKAGVALFGGCCGTTEEHIAALKAALKDAEYVRPAPECLDLLPAATEKEAFFLPADATHGAVLAADARVLGRCRRAGGLPVHDQKAAVPYLRRRGAFGSGPARLSGKSLVRGKSHRRCPCAAGRKIRSAGVKREKEERDGNEHFRPVLYIVKRVTPRRRQC